MERTEALEMIEDLIEQYKDAHKSKKEIPYIQGKLHATLSLLVRLNVLTVTDDCYYSQKMREIITGF